MSETIECKFKNREEKVMILSVELHSVLQHESQVFWVWKDNGAVILHAHIIAKYMIIIMQLGNIKKTQDDKRDRWRNEEQENYYSLSSGKCKFPVRSRLLHRILMKPMKNMTVIHSY